MSFYHRLEVSKLPLMHIYVPAQCVFRNCKVCSKRMVMGGEVSWARICALQGSRLLCYPIRALKERWKGFELLDLSLQQIVEYFWNEICGLADTACVVALTLYTSCKKRVRHSIRWMHVFTWGCVGCNFGGKCLFLCTEGCAQCREEGYHRVRR
jgi:hypothetical protein